LKENFISGVEFLLVALSILVLSLLDDSLVGTVDGKSSFDSEGVITWSVLAFVTIIDPHTSTATTCSGGREREASLVEGRKWADNAVYVELDDCAECTENAEVGGANGQGGTNGIGLAWSVVCLVDSIFSLTTNSRERRPC
jgi:hypothetical protein